MKLENKIYHGAAYYPEAWDIKVIRQDIEHMKKLGIKCAVQETREDIAAETCDTDSVCTGNCAGCDIDHSIANK